MTNSEKTMRESFPKWYAEVSVGDDSSRREARWQGIEAMVSKLNFGDLETLFQLSFGGRAKPKSEQVAKLYEPFSESDPAFDIADNEREMKILAGAALATLMDDLDSSLGDEAALGATTATMFGERSADLPQDLAALGERAIRRRAEANRTRPKIDSARERVQIKVNVAQVSQELSESFDENAVAEAIAKLGTTVQSGFSTIAKRHASAMQSLEHFLEIQDEEMEMLWWLVGEYSPSYSCPFVKVPSEAQPLIFSMELADMTNLLPGPVSIAALLSRTGLSTVETIKVEQVVNAVKGDWLEERVSTKLSSPLMTPIHDAIKRRLETGEGEAWIAGWAAVTELPRDLDLAQLNIATQFYHETLYMLER